MKKLTSITLVLLLCFNMIVPKQKAEATPLALPAGIVVGGGAYALGALAVGSIVSVAIGVEYGDEINKHAMNVWNGSTQLAKDSLQMTMEGVNATGDAMAKFGTDFTDWVSQKANIIAAYGVGVYNKFMQDHAETSEKDFEQKATDGTTTTIVKTTAFPDLVRTVDYKGNVTMAFPADSLNAWSIVTHKGLLSASEVTVSIDSNSLINVTYRNKIDAWSDPTALINNSVIQTWNYIRGTGTGYTLAPSDLGLTLGEFNSKLSEAYTAEEFVNLFQQTMGLDNINVGGQEAWETYGRAKTKLATDIPAMKDAGMVLPVNDIVAHPASDTTKTLTWNPDAGTFEMDGTTYTGDITWTIPKVGTTTGVVEGDVPITVVQTGDGTWVNVKTGESVPVSESPPTDGSNSCSKPWDFKNFKALATTFSTSFPFSIPWDIGRAFDAVFGGMTTGESPEWTLKLGSMLGEGMTEVVVKFPDIVNSWMPFIRTTFLIIFDVSLVYAIRKWFGGAS